MMTKSEICDGIVDIMQCIIIDKMIEPYVFQMTTPDISQAIAVLRLRCSLSHWFPRAISGCDITDSWLPYPLTTKGLRVEPNVNSDGFQVYVISAQHSMKKVLHQ